MKERHCGRESQAGDRLTTFTSAILMGYASVPGVWDGHDLTQGTLERTDGRGDRKTGRGWHGLGRPRPQQPARRQGKDPYQGALGVRQAHARTGRGRAFAANPASLRVRRKLQRHGRDGRRHGEPERSRYRDRRPLRFDQRDGSGSLRPQHRGRRRRRRRYRHRKRASGDQPGNPQAGEHRPAGS